MVNLLEVPPIPTVKICIALHNIFYMVGDRCKVALPANRK